MSRSFMVCVVNTIPGFVVYGIIERGYFSEQHISVTLEFSSPLVMFITVDSDVTGQLVLSSFCLSLFTRTTTSTYVCSHKYWSFVVNGSVDPCTCSASAKLCVLL